MSKPPLRRGKWVDDKYAWNNKEYIVERGFVRANEFDTNEMQAEHDPKTTDAPKPKNIFIRS